MLREERGQCTSCASADLSQSSVHLHCVVDGALLNPMVANSHAWSCEEADLASLGWICVAEQLSYIHRRSAHARCIYTCVAAAAGSGLTSICTCIVSSTLQMGRINRAHMLGVARKLTLRASVEPRKSLGWIKYAENTPRSDAQINAQTQRSC